MPRPPQPSEIAYRWIRTPQFDEMMLAERAYMLADNLTPEDARGADFLDIRPDGEFFFQRHHGRVRTGRWTLRGSALMLTFDDSTSERIYVGRADDVLFVSW